MGHPIYIPLLTNEQVRYIYTYMNSFHCFYLGTINFFNFHELRDILYICTYLQQFKIIHQFIIGTNNITHTNLCEHVRSINYFLKIQQLHDSPCIHLYPQQPEINTSTG